MRFLIRLDWFNSIEPLPISDPQTRSLAPEFTRVQLLEAIHCVSPEGRVYRAARCIRFIGMRLPLLAPLALLMWIPGIIQVSEFLYQWTSRNRFAWGRFLGCQEACRVPSRRQRKARTQ